MTGHVRQTMLALGLGTVVQRVALLATMVALGHALGPAGLGRYALAVATGNLLAALVGAGVRNVCSRQAAREPDRAGGWLRIAVRLRAQLTVLALVPTLVPIVAWCDEPLAFALGALLALPLAWDQKNLLDAVARTDREVAFELGVALLHLVATLALLALRVHDLAALVAVQLLARTLYAFATVPLLQTLPGYDHPPAARAVLRLAALPSATQCAAALLQNGDVWLVRWCGGEVSAGLYAIAQRLASTAALPGAQLLRLLQPHTDRAAAAGDGAATAAKALRTTAYAVLPVVAGGIVVAEPLCNLFGRGFAAAGTTLVGLLLASAALQFAWQCTQILYAHGREGSWAKAQWAGAIVQTAALLYYTSGVGAAGAGFAALLGNCVYLLLARHSLRAVVPVALLRALAPALPIAAATAGAAALAAPFGLLPQLAAGGAAYLAGLYVVELRHSWRRLGHGLQRASGFGTAR